MTKITVCTTIVNAAIFKALVEAGNEATLADPEPVHYVPATAPPEAIDCGGWNTKSPKVTSTVTALNAVVNGASKLN